MLIHIACFVNETIALALAAEVRFENDLAWRGDNSRFNFQLAQVHDEESVRRFYYAQFKRPLPTQRDNGGEMF